MECLLINGCQNVLSKNPNISFNKNALHLLQNHLRLNAIVFLKIIFNLKNIFLFYHTNSFIHYTNIADWVWKVAGFTESRENLLSLWLKRHWWRVPLYYELWIFYVWKKEFFTYICWSNPNIYKFNQLFNSCNIVILEKLCKFIKIINVKVSPPS